MNQLTTTIATGLSVFAAIWCLLVFVGGRLWRSPPPTQRTVPGIGMSMVVAAFACWMFALVVSQSLASRLSGEESPAYSAVLGSGIAATASVPLLLLIIGQRVGIRQIGWHRHKAGKFCRFGLCHMLCWAPMVVAASAWVRLSLGQETPHPVRQLFDRTVSPVEIAVVFYVVAIAAPIVEELLFRGILQTAIANAVGPYVAILTSAALFGAVHGSSWPDPIPLFVFGVLLGYLFQATRSLVPSIVAHAAFNAVNLGMCLLAAGQPV